MVHEGVELTCFWPICSALDGVHIQLVIPCQLEPYHIRLIGQLNLTNFLLPWRRGGPLRAPLLLLLLGRGALWACCHGRHLLLRALGPPLLLLLPLLLRALGPPSLLLLLGVLVLLGLGILLLGLRILLGLRVLLLQLLLWAAPCRLLLLLLVVGLLLVLRATTLAQRLLLLDWAVCLPLLLLLLGALLPVLLLHVGAGWAAIPCCSCCWVDGPLLILLPAWLLLLLLRLGVLLLRVLLLV